MGTHLTQIFSRIKRLYQYSRFKMRKHHQRHVSFGDLFTNRWETAAFLGFGKGSSCYNNVLVLGNVNVGCHTWIGPNVILDGSGGLSIGSYCSISAGVQIYSHDTVDWSISMGKKPITRNETIIGDGVYIGPNVVIQKGVSIGNKAIIGAMSFVNRDIPAGEKVLGTPARTFKS